MIIPDIVHPFCSIAALGKVLLTLSGNKTAKTLEIAFMLN
ncbi:protein of unknown function [Agrobacterium pusense]|uniref:Uncharacterized protein n=1 Tax=Agrobacterium pusense TaxID=648995 RepID=U4Q6D1_9HYPH|nr:protein of unknown function [Agrobacterium pusense]